jgi:hypothetical protein
MNEYIYICIYIRKKYSKMDKRGKDKLVGSPGENGGG